MHSLLKDKMRGFTIVELLIVIVVIGILVTLVIVTFTGMQARARDTSRQTDISAIASHLAVYHADNGYYPTLDNMNDSDWRADNMQGLPEDALQDPRGESPTLASEASDTAYGYTAAAADGESTCNNDLEAEGGQLCEFFELSATLEEGDEDFFIRSSE